MKRVSRDYALMITDSTIKLDQETGDTNAREPGQTSETSKGPRETK